jgi:hypothetical protein
MKAKNKSLAAVQSFERPKFDSVGTPRIPPPPKMYVQALWRESRGITPPIPLGITS